jgi:hypothetical protein
MNKPVRDLPTPQPFEVNPEERDDDSSVASADSRRKRKWRFFG